MKHDYQQAINELSSLIARQPAAIEPLYVCGMMFLTLGLVDPALKCFSRYVDLDPLNPIGFMSLGNALAVAGRYDEAQIPLDSMESLMGSSAFLRAMIAADLRDVEDLQHQVDLGEKAWGVFSHYQPIYAAVVPALNGDTEEVKRLLAPLKQVSGYQSFHIKSFIALLEGKFELGFKYYRRALNASEQLAFIMIKRTIAQQIDPCFSSNAEYQKMLRDFAIDEASISNLNIPPLPF